MWEFQLPLDIFSHDYSPKTEKIYLNLDWIDRENHELAGKIVFTLDATFPEQKKAIDIFGADQTLSFRTKADLGGHSRIILKVLNELYRSELWQVLDREPSTLVDRKVLYNVLAPFAIEGKTVYRKLFRQSDYVGLPSSSKQLLADAVHSVLSHSAIIDIDSDNALFPWSFLYVGDHNDCDGGTTIEPEKFFGFLHEIQANCIGTAKKVNFVNPKKILTAICPGTDSGAHGSSDHPFQKVISLGFTLCGKHDVQTLKSVLRDLDADCFYFFGHAHQATDPDSLSSYIELNTRSLSVADLERLDAPVIRDSKSLVLVFLNGYNTGNLSKWNEYSMAGRFCFTTGDRVCCIATTGSVPKTTAIWFGQYFFRYFFMERCRVGESLLRASRELLAERNDPLGLLYTLFGRVDTQMTTNVYR